MGKIFDWTYQIEEWEADHSKPYDLMAGAHNLFVARAAYEEACRQRPDRPIYLRNGSRVLARSHREPE